MGATRRHLAERGRESRWAINLSSSSPFSPFFLSDERKSFRDTGSAPEERQGGRAHWAHSFLESLHSGGRKVCCARKRMGKWDASHFCIAAGWKFVIEPDMVCAPGADGIL